MALSLDLTVNVSERQASNPEVSATSAKVYTEETEAEWSCTWEKIYVQETIPADGGGDPDPRETPEEPVPHGDAFEIPEDPTPLAELPATGDISTL